MAWERTKNKCAGMEGKKGSSREIFADESAFLYTYVYVAG